MQSITFSDLSSAEQAVLLKAKEAAAHYKNKKGTHYFGSALQTKDGLLFTGASLGRSAASSSTCSERMAVDSAMFNGRHDYTLIATIGFHKDGTVSELMFPCGKCRQILFDYCQDSSPGVIIVSNSDMSKIVRADINELLPFAYTTAGAETKVNS